MAMPVVTFIFALVFKPLINISDNFQYIYTGGIVFGIIAWMLFSFRI